MNFFNSFSKRKWQWGLMLMGFFLMGVQEAIATTYTGDVTLSSQTDVDNFDPAITVVDGSFSVHGTNSSDPITDPSNFANLMEVTGNVFLDFDGPSIKGFEFPNLSSIGGNCGVYGQHADIWINKSGTTQLPKLNIVGGTLSIDGPYLSSVNVHASSLGGLNISGLILQTATVTTPVINGNCSISANTTVSLAGVESVQGNFHVSNVEGQVLELTNLVEVGGSFNVSLPFYGNTITAPLLESVGGDFKLYGNDILSTIDFGSLTSVDGNFDLNYNSSLSNCESFYEVLSSEGVTGSINISNNQGDCETLATILAAYASPCEADLTLTTQAEVDAYDCTVHNGDLTIDGSDSDITNLDALAVLEEVTGSLIIEHTNIVELDGLAALTQIGADLKIKDNSYLASISGFNALSVLGDDLTIKENSALAFIGGFVNLTTVPGYVDIDSNGNLTSLAGLQNITTIGQDLNIEFNAGLPALDDFNNLVSVGEYVEIQGNGSLPSVNGFNNLTSVASYFFINDNDDMGPINGFANLNSVSGYFEINGNQGGGSVNGFNNLSSVGGDFEIDDNEGMTSVDGFNAMTGITGEFNITNNGELTDLAGFASLASVSEKFEFYNNGDFSSFPSFNALQTVGSHFYLWFNQGLPALDDFAALTSVGGDFKINGNDVITSINGFSNLATVDGAFEIEQNDGASSIGGFASLASIGGGLAINQNNGLTNISGLNVLTNVGFQLEIKNNPTLTAVSGLNALETVSDDARIQGNINLTDVSGLQSLNFIGDSFKVTGNSVLKDCCIFYDLLTNGTIDGGADIFSNHEDEGCNSVEEITTGAVTAQCHESIEVSLDENGSAEIAPAQVNDNSYGNCGIDSYELSQTTFDCLDAYATWAPGAYAPTVTLTVTDANGASDECETTVEVMDSHGPTLQCHTSIEVELDDSGNATIDFFAAASGYPDENCFMAFLEFDPGEGPIPYSIEFTQEEFDCSNIGTPVTITMTLLDELSELSDACDVEVNVVDGIMPILNCHTEATVFTHPNNGITQIDHAIFLAEPTTDNCTASGNITYQLSQSTVGCSDLAMNVGMTPITITAQDESGNTSECTVQVEVLDITAPRTPTSFEKVLYLDENGGATLTGQNVPVFDNCTDYENLVIDFNGFDEVSFDCSHIGTNPNIVPVTATDESGNVFTGDLKVEVIDNSGPTAICKNLTVYIDENGQFDVCAADFDNGSYDNCSTEFDFFIFEDESCAIGDCSDMGTHGTLILVEDEAGNGTFCEVEISIVDEIVPMVNGGDPYTFTVDVYLDENGQAEISEANIDNVFTDNCTAPENLAITFDGSSTYSLDCSHLAAGQHEVEFKVEDESGNFVTQMVTVSVHDPVAPTIECQDIMVDLNPQGTATIDPEEVLASVTDNCSTSELTYVLEETEVDCYQIGENVFTLTVTDADGNTDVCETTVTVNPLVTIDDIIVTDETCEGFADGSLDILASGPGQLMYSIDGGEAWNLVGFFENLDPTGYDVKVRIQGAPGCIDSDFAEIEEGTTAALWYKDIDGDGYTDGTTQTACSQPTGYVAEALPDDCNDYDALQYPGQIWYEDLDGDGYGSGNWTTACERPASCFSSTELIETDTDCDDAISTCYPGAPEICNGEDDDCDGEIDEDVSEGLTYDGNVTLSNQAQVDAFSSCYSVIDGNLYIKNSGITELSNLINLEEVTGYVYVKSTSLTDMTGLDNLTTVGGYLKVQSNNSMTSLNGLQNVTAVGGYLRVYFNNNLTDCCAIHALLENEGVNGSTTIFRNDTGCDSEGEIEEYCTDSEGLMVSDTNNDVQFGNVAVTEFQQVEVFPNPASGMFNIRIAKEYENASVRLINAQGKLMRTVELDSDTAQFQFDVDDIPLGIYLLEVELDGEQFTERLIVK